MKKIYFIRFNKTKYGGAEKYLQRLSKILNTFNIQHTIVYSPLPKWIPSWLRILISNFLICFNKNKKFYFSLDRISCPEIYRAGDGVHKAFLKTKKPSLNPLHLVYLAIEKKTFQNSKKIIANSNLVKSQIIENYNINPDKIEVIYNGIEIKEFNKQKSKEKIIQEFSIPKDKKIILFAGSGFKRKGVKEFLEIISKLKHPFQAFILGKEKRINRYKQIAKKLGVENKVIFTGPRSDINDFYAAADIFLFPTHYEPFSNVVLEALSFNNVVLTTKQNGASEIIDQRYIMESPNDFSITQEIEKLLSDKVLLDKEQIKCRKIAENFTIEKNARKTLQLIEKVLKHETTH
ncbi:glycosyltransferase family 4 protein [Hydrogenimonas thermophila]|uniref:glycosyltransferase family 4 protein n=1 Tax=Hydrogenimonas thermophila TaxID=223786 RepID=UPI0029373A0D|nr:glycosyltransferase family 4 protein [Hydrogenimonas thermophila]WOE70348.1 glycosyltransferase family 4 protein [Hydrogenimonas thermophila]WOE72865.1 glycosyltransferase family 4 protein [Hydrogenimonas thermophila]